MAELTDTQKLSIDVGEVRREVHALREGIDRLTSQLSQLSEFKLTMDAHDVVGKLKYLSDSNEHTEKRLSMWLNRGFGAWFAFALLIGSVIAMLQFNFSEMHAQFKESQAEIQKLREKNIEIEHRLKTLGVKAVKVSTRCAVVGKLPPECKENPPPVTIPPYPYPPQKPQKPQGA